MRRRRAGLLYAVDIAAWDLLLGVALLCAALVPLTVSPRAMPEP